MAGGTTGDQLRDEVLARLAAVDPTAAQEASAALDWMVGAEGLAAVSQLAVQQLCWYDLPFKWVVPRAERRRVLAGLARFLDLAGLPRYADVCRSSTTSEVHAAWAADPAAGYRAWRRAAEQSGIEPPDPEPLRWAALMGPAELAAFRSCALALELAVVAGDLRPGAAGWRADQRRIVDGQLDRPRPERLGETMRQAVVTERLVHWVEGTPWTPQPSRARAQLLAAVADRLLHDDGVPRGAGRALGPLRRLLGIVAEAEVGGRSGVAMTPTGALPVAVVRAVVGEVRAPDGGSGGGARRRASREAIAAAEAVVGAGRQLGLVRHRSGHLVMTPAGRRAAGGVSALWAAAADGLLARTGVAGTVDEVALAVLVEGGDAGSAIGRTELDGLVGVVVAEAGWVGGQVGEPLPGAITARLVDDLVDVLDALGLLRRGRPSPRGQQALRLSAAGVALARAALRRRVQRTRAVEALR